MLRDEGDSDEILKGNCTRGHGPQSASSIKSVRKHIRDNKYFYVIRELESNTPPEVSEMAISATPGIKTRHAHQSTLQLNLERGKRLQSYSDVRY